MAFPGPPPDTRHALSEVSAVGHSDPEEWIALNLLPRLSPAAAFHAVERCGGAGEAAYRMPPRTLVGDRPRAGADAEAAIAEARKDLRRRAARELSAAGRLGLRIVPRPDPDYPPRLATLDEPPLLLYVKGSIATFAVRIAMVGSRRPSAYGRRVGAGLAAALAARGVEVVSGGARGIDAAAHEGALEAGGKTVAVLGSGFGKVYPPEHVELFDRIASSGAVISEFPLETDPRPENFPRRNRLISGLASAVIVVEAAARSGSLITAGHALDQGRDVMAVPGPVSSNLSEGCHRLIQSGAKLVHTSQDIIEELPPSERAMLAGTSHAGASLDNPVNLADLSDDEAAALALLDDPEPVHLEVIADRAPFGISRLLVALFGLECRGAVEQLPGGYYLGRPLRGGRWEERS